MRYQDKIKNSWKHGDHSSKAQLGLSKKFIIRYDYSIMAAANVNMRFKTNDLLSSNFVVDPF
jgi:hypothetical protein